MWCREDTMTEYPYILFNKSPEQMRRLGACGGRAYGRNQRARRALGRTPPEVVPPRAVPRETVAQAIHVLDAQFPWLHGAEKQLSREPGVAPAPAAPRASAAIASISSRDYAESHITEMQATPPVRRCGFA